MRKEDPGSATALTGLSSRDRILFSAKHLFANRGYENTSTSAIARAASTSESQLIKHFGSKEGVLEAIFDSGWNGLASMLQQVQHLRSPEQKLFAILDGMLTFLDKDADLKELMLLEGRRIRKEGSIILMTRGYLQMVSVADAVLREMQEAGRLASGLSIEATRSALIGMCEGLLRDQILARRMNFPAKYSSDELRAVFALMVKAISTSK